MTWTKIFAAAAAACMMFASCGAKDITVDIHSLAEELNTGIVYDDPLEKLDSEMTGMIYELGDLEAESVVYMGSGATSEEIAVFDCGNAETAKEVKTVVEEHVKSQISSFEDYLPAETAKLNEAVVRQEGKYVALSVSNDPDTANKIMDEHFK